MIIVCLCPSFLSQQTVIPIMGQSVDLKRSGVRQVSSSYVLPDGRKGTGLAFRQRGQLKARLAKEVGELRHLGWRLPESMANTPVTPPLPLDCCPESLIQA